MVMDLHHARFVYNSKHHHHHYHHHDFVPILAIAKPTRMAYSKCQRLFHARVCYILLFSSSLFLSSPGFISSLYLSVRHNFCLSRHHFAQSVALDTFLSTRSKVRLEKCWPLKSHYVNIQNIAASLAFLTYLSFLFRITFPLTRRYTTYYHLFSFSVENVFFCCLQWTTVCSKVLFSPSPRPLLIILFFSYLISSIIFIAAWLLVASRQFLLLLLAVFVHLSCRCQRWTFAK